MSRILFLMPTQTYRAGLFLEAAQKLNLDAVVGSDQRQTLEVFTPGKSLALNFYNLEQAKQKIVEFSKTYPIDAIIPVDDDTAVLAAAAAQVLSLPGNPPESVRIAREKHRLREQLALAGLPTPQFLLFSTTYNPKELSELVEFPCVLKPIFLSASRGVVRANDAKEFVAAFKRITRLLSDPEIVKHSRTLAKKILVESYIPGDEFVLEGVLTHGKLQVLAIFDKPDPLEGPFFEETIYVTPSRFPQQVQAAIIDCVNQAAQTIGLRHGPIHAEIRVNEQRAWLIELAARSIGGLCSRSLRFDGGISLEELTLRHALGMNIDSIQREKLASGVMMIPIPKAGILKAVRGIDRAKTVPHIEDVRITIPLEQNLIPWPEGNRYLGFIFARAETPEQVEKAIRESYGRLNFVIE
jgi:biotin carboxylase